MGQTAQEKLLAERIAALEAMKEDIKSRPYTQHTRADAQQMFADIGKQIEALEQEAELREGLRVFSALKSGLDHYDQYFGIDPKSARFPSIVESGRAAAIKEIEAAKTAMRELGVDLPDDLTHDELREATDAACAHAMEQLENLRADKAALYANDAVVGDPCVPCLQARLNSILANDEHFKRAMASAKHHTGKQKNKDTCALMSLRSLLLERDGSAPPEGLLADKQQAASAPAPNADGVPPAPADMIDIGLASGAYKPCNGTGKTADLMTYAGIPASMTKKPSLGAIAKALDEGKAVIVGYDARPIYYGADPDKWTKPNSAPHAVRVTGVDRALNGAIRGFWVNDSGTLKGAAKYVSAAVMQMALDGHKNGGKLTTSHAPFLKPLGQE